MDATGNVLDKGGIAVCVSSGSQEFPNVAFDGSKLLAAWRDHTSYCVKGERLSTTGNILDTNTINISSSTAGLSGVGTAGISSGFMVAWSLLNSADITNSSALITPVSDGGAVSNPPGTVASSGLNNQNTFAVADSGTEYGVVWAEYIAGSYHIMGARYSHAGQLITTTSVPITANVAGNQTEPAIAWNGSEYLVVWSGDANFATDDWDIFGLRLQRNLSAIDSSPLSICAVGGLQANPAVASNGNNFAVAWEDSRYASSPYYYNDIFGVIVNADGTTQANQLAICTATGNQLSVKVASNGTDYLAAWDDYRNAYPQVCAARVTSSGTILDTNGIMMPATSEDQITPDVCYGNGNYLVTWSDMTMLSCCRISTSGSLLDKSGITINADYATKTNPGTIWDGTNYQIVWEDFGSSFQGNSDICGTTVSGAGVVSPNLKSPLVCGLQAELTPRIFYSQGAGTMFFSQTENYANLTCAVSLQNQQAQVVASVAAAKQLAIGTPVILNTMVVTAAFPGCFYIQYSNKPSGIKVVSSVQVNQGDSVNVTGTVDVFDSERQITASAVSDLGAASSQPKPVGIRGDALGGGSLNCYTPGIVGGCGTNNIGLLVKTWGQVVSTSSGTFCIQPQAGIQITVESGTLIAPAVGKIVAVTGISTCVVTSGSTCRAIRPRSQSDIVLYD